jgi:16S rRNA (guanine527-N7)-methyltransferase
MDLARIATLLQPSLAAPIQGGLSFRAGFSLEESAVLTQGQLRQFSTYLDLLLRWNARTNLTSVREPEAIVTRHFGESLFAARQLFPAQSDQPETRLRLLDFGSGAGFPGLPIKIWAPQVELTLIESHQKKATFLREVIRALGLDTAEVFSGRAEDFQERADVVTLRAVEKFERSLPVAARLVSAGGRLALLIGEGQVARTREFEPTFQWLEPLPIPLSSNRVLLIGGRKESS